MTKFFTIFAEELKISQNYTSVFMKQTINKLYMSDELLSVIVPVYNAENYLTRCVDSLLSQSHDNMEIILVDDGSTDSSGALCDYMAQSHPRVATIHKENGGLSSARTIGLKHASGKFVTFVDSDDFISDSKTYEYALNCFVDNPQLKIVQFPYRAVYNDSSKDYLFSPQTTSVFRGG